MFCKDDGMPWKPDYADQAMTSHYTHIEAQAHRAAVEAVAKLVEGDGS